MDFCEDWASLFVLGIPDKPFTSLHLGICDLGIPVTSMRLVRLFEPKHVCCFSLMNFRSKMKLLLPSGFRCPWVLDVGWNPKLCPAMRRSGPWSWRKAIAPAGEATKSWSLFENGQTRQWIVCQQIVCFFDYLFQVVLDKMWLKSKLSSFFIFFTVYEFGRCHLHVKAFQNLYFCGNVEMTRPSGFLWPLWKTRLMEGLKGKFSLPAAWPKTRGTFRDFPYEVVGVLMKRLG